MKLSYPEWEKTVCMEEQDIPVISMENPLYHYDRLMELYRQIQGDTGGFVLFEEETHLDLRKKSVLLLSPLDMDFNNRKILTKLFAALREEAMTESFTGKQGQPWEIFLHMQSIYHNRYRFLLLMIWTSIL